MEKYRFISLHLEEKSASWSGVPDTMQMIGQHGYGVDNKRPLCTHPPKGLF
jgi:hypothetical protein